LLRYGPQQQLPTTHQRPTNQAADDDDDVEDDDDDDDDDDDEDDDDEEEYGGDGDDDDDLGGGELRAATHRLPPPSSSGLGPLPGSLGGSARSGWAVENGVGALIDASVLQLSGNSRAMLVKDYGGVGWGGRSYARFDLREPLEMSVDVS
jgi:hypothetical protein